MDESTKDFDGLGDDLGSKSEGKGTQLSQRDKGESRAIMDVDGSGDTNIPKDAK